MTTKPKVKKYNTDRGETSAHNVSGEAREEAVERIRRATHGAGMSADSAPSSEIEGIKREGLTGRQLRMARR